MTDQHPLTDEMCEELSCFYLFNFGDTGEGIVQDMRAAADWQLEQVIEWLETALEYDPELANTRPYIHLDLKEAMRPQEDNQ